MILTITPVKAQQQELYYDDGSADFGFVASPGTLGAVKFSVSSRTQVLKLKFYVWGEMTNVRVHVLDQDFNSIYSLVVTPYSGWFEVDVSYANIVVEGDFYVGWQWITEAPSGPWLGVDTTPPHNQRSYLGTLGKRDTSPKSGEDYLIRVFTQETAPAVTDYAQLYFLIGVVSTAGLVGGLLGIRMLRQRKKGLHKPPPATPRAARPPEPVEKPVVKPITLRMIPSEVDQMVYDYIVHHKGVISISQAARDLNLTLEELYASFERLKKEGKIK